MKNSSAQNYDQEEVHVLEIFDQIRDWKIYIEQEC